MTALGFHRLCPAPQARFGFLWPVIRWVCGGHVESVWGHYPQAWAETQVLLGASSSCGFCGQSVPGLTLPISVSALTLPSPPYFTPHPTLHKSVTSSPAWAALQWPSHLAHSGSESIFWGL